MSTDIVDKDLKALRNARWDKAFNNMGSSSSKFDYENPRDEVNRKATIVIEHIIQVCACQLYCVWVIKTASILLQLFHPLYLFT